MASSTATEITSEFCFDNTVSTKITKNIFLNEKYADFHFLFNEGGVQKRVPAHKAILAAASDVFATMLNGQWVEENETEIPDASSDVFIEFLQFLYLPQVKVSAENISEVINLGNKYNVRECMELCAEQIKQQVTSDDACTGLDLALQFDLDELKDHCLAEISEETSKVLGTEAFLGCSKLSLKNILALDEVACDEIEMFNASLNWAKQACESKKTDPSVIANIREELGDCLYAIRFGAMTTEEVSSCVTKCSGLFNQIEFEDLFQAIGGRKSEAKIFKNIAQRTTIWKDDKILECRLEGVYHGYRRDLLRTESTTFQVSKRLWLGQVFLGAVYDRTGYAKTTINIQLFVFEMDHGTQKEILHQRFETNTSSISLKFEKPIKVKANTEYEVRIEIPYGNWYVDHSAIGPNQQKKFGDGIVIQTKGKCSNLIRSLNFNQ